MTTDFAARLAKVPPKILETARATTWPNAPLSDVLDTAEMLMRHLAGEKPSEDRHLWQPFLTARQTRLILQALEEFETVIDDDVEPLRSLREWFKGTLHG
jgi:hypothetical protein